MYAYKRLLDRQRRGARVSISTIERHATMLRRSLSDIAREICRVREEHGHAPLPEHVRSLASIPETSSVHETNVEEDTAGCEGREDLDGPLTFARLVDVLPIKLEPSYFANGVFRRPMGDSYMNRKQKLRVISELRRYFDSDVLFDGDDTDLVAVIRARHAREFGASEKISFEWVIVPYMQLARRLDGEPYAGESVRGTINAFSKLFQFASFRALFVESDIRELVTRLKKNYNRSVRAFRR